MNSDTPARLTDAELVALDELYASVPAPLALRPDEFNDDWGLIRGALKDGYKWPFAQAICSQSDHVWVESHEDWGEIRHKGPPEQAAHAQWIVEISNAYPRLRQHIAALAAERDAARKAGEFLLGQFRFMVVQHETRERELFECIDTVYAILASGRWDHSHDALQGRG